MVVNRSSAHALIELNSSILICMHLGVDSKIKFAERKLVQVCASKQQRKMCVLESNKHSRLKVRKSRQTNMKNVP